MACTNRVGGESSDGLAGSTRKMASMGTGGSEHAGLAALLTALVLAIATVAPSSAVAQSGATLTPDLRTFLVNKDVGEERWTIALHRNEPGGDRINNITGNVFRPDGGPASFVLCQVREDSTATLADPASQFRLRCSGSAACPSSAEECARADWLTIAEDLAIDAEFFLPPGGLGNVALANPAAVPPSPLLARAGHWLDEILAVVLAGPREAVAQAAARGATLSLDGYNYLVSKDLGGLRWSISLNFVPTQGPGGGLSTSLLSVTGNIFDPGGGAPGFVHCVERSDSRGRLDDETSDFRFRCAGADSCAGGASDCATGDWAEIPGGDDVSVPASFFLPPLGRPAAVASDPEVVVLGRTSAPPAIITNDFELVDGGVARIAGTNGLCTRQACLATRIGSCEQVPGVTEPDGQGGCGCRIDPVPDECILCGPGECGNPCEFDVGSATARGRCLPWSAETNVCTCQAIAAGSDAPDIEGCGSTLDLACPADRCCADDPRDGCSPDAGDLDCAGVCVDAASCDPASGECGICRSVGGERAPVGGPPTLDFTADPLRIPPGGSAVLRWTAQNATRCTATLGWIGERPVTGNETVSPDSTRAYQLTCVGPAGEVSGQVTIIVSDEVATPTPTAPPAPTPTPSPSGPTVDLEANPTTLPVGGIVTLTWESTGATECEASGGWRGPQPVAGQAQFTPSFSVVYTITCRGPGGEASDDAAVTVDVSSAPVARAVTFDSVVQGDGIATGSGTLTFLDPDLDVTAADFTVLSGPGASFVLGVTQVAVSDALPFTMACNNTLPNGEMVVVSVTLSDASGKTSNAVQFQFLCL